METFSTIFAGLGLFIIGLKTISRHLKKMSSARFRHLLRRATRSYSSSSLTGLAIGATTQSSNAAIMILAAMVSAGLITTLNALPVMAWASVGTSALVMIATFDTHTLVLYLLGCVGLLYFFDLDKSERFKDILGALFGIALLLVGLWFIKSGSAPLKEIEWVQAFLLFSADAAFIAIFIGLFLTLITQSSATVTIFAVTMISVGMLTLEQTWMLIIGANLGSGLSAYLMTLNLGSEVRRLVLMQLLYKGFASLFILALIILENTYSFSLLDTLFSQVSDTIATQVACFYLLLQLTGALFSMVSGRRLYRVIEKMVVMTESEELAKPLYLKSYALEDDETALDLVSSEQKRLLKRLPDYYDQLRIAEVGQVTHQEHHLYQSSLAVAEYCDAFLTELTARSQSKHAVRRLVNYRQRQDIINNLQEHNHQLVTTLNAVSHIESDTSVASQLIEGLHALLLIFADTLDDEDYDLLLAISGDRSELMERIRHKLFDNQSAFSQAELASLTSATTIVERIIWLIYRYAQLNQTHSQVGASAAIRV